jgi:hypothetical protein
MVEKKKKSTQRDEEDDVCNRRRTNEAWFRFVGIEEDFMWFLHLLQLKICYKL